MYGQLGDIVFENMLSPNSQELTGSAVYAEHALVNGKPRLQRTGDTLDDLKIGMKLHVNFCKPEDVIKQLVAYRSSGAVCRYITGSGRLVGTFVVVSIKQNDLACGPNGGIIETDLEVSLLESVAQDAASASAAAAIDAGVAMSNNTPVERVVSITPLTATAIAGAETVAVNAGTTNLQAQIKAAEINPSSAELAMAKAKQQAAKMQTSIAKAVTAVNTTTLEIYDATRDYVDACTVALGFIETFRAACEANDILAAAAALIDVSGSNASINTTAEVLAKIQGSRIPVPTNG